MRTGGHADAQVKTLDDVWSAIHRPSVESNV